MTGNIEADANGGDKKPKRGLRHLTPSTMISRSPSSASAISSTRTIADRSQSTSTVYTLSEAELRKQDSLISFILDGEPIRGTLVSCCLWYTQCYLQTQIRNQWTQLRMALVGLTDGSPTPLADELVVVFEFLIIVAKLLKTQKDLTLVDIVDELDNEGKLKSQLDEERAIPNQVAFAAVGWLTMLYEAVPQPKLDKLEVTKTSRSSHGFRNTLNTRKYYTYSLGFEYIDLPLYNLLSRFGDLIPEGRPPITYEPPSSRSDLPESIYVASVCFQALHEFAELNIEWVTSLALHLELDSSKKTLKVFQFPSFCRIMTVERRNNILSRLLNDHGSKICEDVTRPDIPTDRFFSELLCTYRLIFGQDSRSRNIFKQIVPTFEEQLRSRSSESEELPWDFDPLIRSLCSRSCHEGESAHLYEELHNSETAHYYNPHEFPFFGSRLLELQKLVNEQPAQTVVALLRDRRNLASWWAFQTNHILIFFATATIFLMILGLVFQIWQVILSQQQLRQGHS